MPYWLKAKSGALVFDFIDTGTNVGKLKESIEAGVVWVREEDEDDN